MLANSLKFRAAVAAFLFGPPRVIKRDEASAIHGRVCDSLGLDDLTFTYGKTQQGTTYETSGFSVLMGRAEGRGGLKIEIDMPSQGEPLRVVMGYDWPQSLESAKQRLDAIAVAILDETSSPWTRVMAETRIVAECAVTSNAAAGYMANELFRLSPQWLESLGKPLVYTSMKFEVEAEPSTDSLATPKRVLGMEVLRADPAKLFIELISQWPQIVARRQEDLEKVRPIDRKPSEYISESQQYLTQRLAALKPGANQS